MKIYFALIVILAQSSFAEAMLKCHLIVNPKAITTKSIPPTAITGFDRITAPLQLTKMPNGFRWITAKSLDGRIAFENNTGSGQIDVGDGYQLTNLWSSNIRQLRNPVSGVAEVNDAFIKSISQKTYASQGQQVNIRMAVSVVSETEISAYHLKLESTKGTASAPQAQATISVDYNGGPYTIPLEILIRFPRSQTIPPWPVTSSAKESFQSVSFEFQKEASSRNGQVHLTQVRLFGHDGKLVGRLSPYHPYAQVLMNRILGSTARAATGIGTGQKGLNEICVGEQILEAARLERLFDYRFLWDECAR